MDGRAVVSVGVNKPAIAGQKLLFMLVTVLMALFTSFAVNGVAYGAEGDSAAARKELVTYVKDQVKDKEYKLAGGGSLKGSELFSSENGKLDISEKAFNSLDEKSKTEFVSSVAVASRKSYDPTVKGTPKNVTQNTVTAWMKDIQSKDGIGSRLMTEITSNIRPDFVQANEVVKPLSSPLNVAVGVAIVVTIMLLTLSFAVDISVITIPWFRSVVESATTVNDGDGKVMSKLKGRVVSKSAVKAIKKEEDENVGSASVLWYYVKDRFLYLIVFGLAVYLIITGKAFEVAGWAVNAVSNWL